MSAEPSFERPVIEVAAAVIRDGRGRLLLSQRPKGKHLAGLWEFPGGKCEPGESAHAALVRELHEELGIEVDASEPLLSLTHHYAEKSVRLLMRTVDRFTGTARGCEGQAVDWFELSAARALSMPAADRPILQLLSLDPRMAMVDAFPDSGSIEAIVDGWRARLEAGYKLLCLPGRGVDDRRLGAMVERCDSLARQFDARWLLGGRPALSERLGADGVHLHADELSLFDSRPVAADRVLAVTCRHDADLKHAARLDADFACLSPSTAKGAPDWPDFAARVAASPVPVVVLGVSPVDLATVRELGAFGIAATPSGAATPVDGAVNQG